MIQNKNIKIYKNFFHNIYNINCLDYTDLDFISLNITNDKKVFRLDRFKSHFALDPSLVTFESNPRPKITFFSKSVLNSDSECTFF